MKEDIRKILLEEIDNIRTKKTELKTSRVVIKAAAQVVYTDRLKTEEKVHSLKLRKFIKGT